MADDSAAIREAATLVLLRDGDDGLQVLLLQRNAGDDFAAGAWVFPGGRLEAADRDVAGGGTARAARQTAVRETQEEAALAVDPQSLIYFAHWTTPLGAPKRYATWFFAAAMPAGQAVVVDGQEIVGHAWLAPAHALAEHRAGRLGILPPTYITLEQLAACADTAAALAWLRQRPPEVFVPKTHVCDREICFLYQDDAAYASGVLDAPGARHRFWMGRCSRYEKSHA